MEQEAQAPISIYTTPVTFMGKEVNFDKGLINRPYEYKGRVCYCTGFYTVGPDGTKYMQVHTRHSGKATNDFISEAKLRNKSKDSIPFEKAA